LKVLSQLLLSLPVLQKVVDASFRLREFGRGVGTGTTVGVEVGLGSGVEAGGGGVAV